MGTEFVSYHLSSSPASSAFVVFQPFFFNMKFVIALLVLAVAVYAEENKPSPVGQCLKDFRDCVSEACRIPECWDAHVQCRKEAKGFVDYFWCNVHYMKCMHEHRHDNA